MDFQTINEAKDLAGKKVLVRVDWNVPIQEGKITDDYRIQKSLPTVDYLMKAGAEVILATHFGESDGKPVYEYAKKKNFNLLPNLRDNPGEKGNSAEFAEELASKADIYVNEAFSASHREHASIVSVPKLLPAYAGFQFKEEVKNLSEAFAPDHPFLFILGGAKFETKLPLLNKFIHIADNIFVGGALAHNFFKQGGIDIKSSLVFEGEINLKPLIESKKVILPADPLWLEDKIVDAGPKALENLKKKISEAKFILWNGPLGNYEIGFKDGTLRLAEMIANSNTRCIVGGGDTLAAIKELDIFDKFSFVSTGGGAMLDFLANETLPGIEALKKETV